jgi:hypothetical protein
MAQGIQDPDPNPVRAKGEQALIDRPEDVIKALESGKSLYEVAKELEIVSDSDTEAAIIKSISEADQDVVRAAVIQALRASKGNKPEYDCDVVDPADHVAKNRGIKVQARGNAISFKTV